MQVQRSRRRTPLALAQQFFRYGQGRASHLGYRFGLRDLQFLMPSMLIVAALAAALTAPGALVVVALSYVAALIVAGWSLAGIPGRTLPHFVLAAATMHVSYGLGLLFGFFLKIRRSAESEVNLRITEFPRRDK
jgi:hypothetical protein